MPQPICAVVYCTRNLVCDALVVEREDRFHFLVGQLVEHIEDIMSHPPGSHLALLTDVFLSAMDNDEVYRWVVDDMWRRIETNHDLLSTSSMYSTREQHCMDRMRNFRDFLESYCISKNSV
jgi:NDP-sugar pyrophosphorylase family protein